VKGRQYKVTEGDEILVDRLGDEKPEVEVLMRVANEEVQLGDPVLKEGAVKVKGLGEEAGEKIYVSKYKAKSKYRKRTGHKSKYTKLLIEKV